MLFYWFISRGRGSSGPWLLFISENGYGKRVPVSSFRTSSLNRVGLKGYKVGYLLSLISERKCLLQSRAVLWVC